MLTFDDLLESSWSRAASTDQEVQSLSASGDQDLERHAEIEKVVSRFRRRILSIKDDVLIVMNFGL